MSGTTDPGNKSSAQIEREVEGTRARLTNTIEELRDRVSPGQMMEEAVSYFRGSGGNEMVQNLGRQLRDNPMPALLIGAGIAWMMLGSRSSANAYTSPSSTTYTQPPRPLSGTTPHGPETRHLAGAPAYVPASGSTSSSSYTSSSSTSSSGPGLGDRVTGAVHDARDGVSSAASGLYERASDAAGRVGEAASAAWESATGAAGSAQARMSDARMRAADAAYYQSRALREQGRQGLDYVVRDQPLILGAIGLAVGAAVGALIPNTEAENRLMGETRDRLADQARDLAEEGYERVSQVANQHLEQAQGIASETYGKAKDRLDEGGLSPSKAGAALGEVARDLADAVTKTVHNVTEEVKGAAQEAKREVKEGELPAATGATSSKPGSSPNVTRL
ncbi:MAG TPA: DUF3618 domain-containing protein [Acetobacteraceae bacterium]|jgi:ElaB/YqjD/DUF883 family membrane-anchored ribosome-binding protein|nr:DUF3618 domain-containing protein [Acetobacteraceae bacterium]